MRDLTLAIDQSTQGTKVLLIDAQGHIAYKAAKGHRQIIDQQGWISHDLNEIKANLKTLIHDAMHHLNGDKVSAVAITNQRETAAAWSKQTGKPLSLAIVWQDNRARSIVKKLAQAQLSSQIKHITGLDLSPYFTAAKFAWLQENSSTIAQAKMANQLCLGTIDSWLLFMLTSGKAFKTEPSNACRTQLMDLTTGKWSPALCHFFGIDMATLPQISDSDSLFGKTDLFGELNYTVPIVSILGDSQAALYAENCVTAGQYKVTFGTGSSIVLNTGDKRIAVTGLNTSIAWRKNGQTTYILEGNVNCSGAIITWLKNNLQLIDDPAETDKLAQAANPEDTTILIPAFSGMAAPYNYPDLKATLAGMTMTTGRNEIVRAALNAIVFQIADILRLMQQAFSSMGAQLYADGGMIANQYLMQRLSDITQLTVVTAVVQELSAMGTMLNGTTQTIQHPINKRYLPAITQTMANQVRLNWTKQINQLIK